MKKLTALLSAIALLCTLFGCKAKSDLIGSYCVTVDIYDTVVTAFDQSLGTVDSAYSICNYLPEFTITMIYAFHHDGTYKISLDHEALNASLETLRTAVRPLLDRQLTDALKAEFSSYGIPLENAEDIEELMGKSMDTYFSDAMGMTQDVYIETLITECFADAMRDTLIAEGQFIAAEGMLYLSDSPNTAPSEDSYETYVIGKDGTVVITGSVNVKELFSYPYLLTPKN